MINKIGFGGGCHWCTEAIFQSLIGVEKVEQGWIASSIPYETFSEAVIVNYNELIDLEILIEVHLLTHSSTNSHSFREKYRSAIYYFSHDDKQTIQEIITQKSFENKASYITKVLPFISFKLNRESQIDYYLKNKDKLFCQTYINPKLTLLRKTFGKRIKEDF